MGVVKKSCGVILFVLILSVLLMSFSVALTEITECEYNSDCASDNNYCLDNAAVHYTEDCVDGFCLPASSTVRCDDGLFCNGAETCFEGECVDGSPVDCDDSDSCTIDSCNEQEQNCIHTLNDIIGPVTSNLLVNPEYNNGVFDITATATDMCSPIERSEYFVRTSSSGSNCGVPGTGIAMDAVDGSINELIEDLEKEDVEFFNDGQNKVCVQSKDVLGNWGNCQCYYYESDTIPPEIIGEVKLNDVVNPQELLICGDDPTLYVTVCDSESDIQGGEFFLDMLIPPTPIPAPWTGIWLTVINEYMDGGLHCADLSAVIDLTRLKLGDGTHYINQIRGKDIVENWGKIYGQNFNFSFIKDTLPPVTSKIIYPQDKVSVPCQIDNPMNGHYVTDGCYFVKQGTTIELSAVDPDPQKTGEFAGNVVIYYRIWWSLDGESWTLQKEGQGAIDSNVLLTLNEDSYHLIEYWATDGCGWEETHHFELDIVDTQAPETTKEILGPKYTDPASGKTYLDGKTTIALTCVDGEPHPVNMVKIYYRYFVDGIITQDWRQYEAPFSFPEESVHQLEYYCVDALGNTEQVQTEIDYVDHTKPETTKTYGLPLVNTDGYPKWITSQTPITLSAVDEDTTGFGCNSGVNYIQYRVTLVDDSNCYRECEASGAGDWTMYSSPFTIGETSCHLIEYNAIDNVLKTEEVKKQCVFVDNEAPLTIKTVGDSKYDKQDDADWWITQNTPIELNCEDVMPHPVGDIRLYYRYYKDGTTAPEFTETKGYADLSSEIVENGDCKHRLEWYCVDALGNSEGSAEQPIVEIDQVDTQGPIIVKWVEDTGAVQSGESIEVCANVTDIKQTQDAGVGVAWVKAKFALGDDPEEITLTHVDGNTYCGEWTVPEIKSCIKYKRCIGEVCEYRCVWHVEVQSEDLLGNYNAENGIEIIVDDADPMIKYVLNPPSGRYYRDGMPFSVYAPAIDFGGDENIFNSDNCKASGVRECRFYAFDYPYEDIDQEEIKNFWDYIFALGDVMNHPNVVYLGSVPYIDGVCKGHVTIPEESGLTDKAFLAYEIEDNAGNMDDGLAEDANGNLIIMDIDNENPGVVITNAEEVPSVLTEEDNLVVKAEVVDYESGFDECWADLYKYDGEIIVDTGINLDGQAVNFNLCEINDEIPTGLTSGYYELKVNARDEMFNIGSAWLGITIDNTRPEMGIISPAEGETYGLMLPVSLHITDNSGIAEETVKIKITEIPAVGNLYCVFGACEETEWILLSNTDDDLYTGEVDLEEQGISGQGRYTFNAVACDPLYSPDETTLLGFSINKDRNDMHCRMISEHGVTGESRTQCNDGLDNDGDGYTDLEDKGCFDSEDDDEYNVVD